MVDLRGRSRGGRIVLTSVVEVRLLCDGDNATWLCWVSLFGDDDVQLCMFWRRDRVKLARFLERTRLRCRHLAGVDIWSPAPVHCPSIVSSAPFILPLDLPGYLQSPEWTTPRSMSDIGGELCLSHAMKGNSRVRVTVRVNLTLWECREKLSWARLIYQVQSVSSAVRHGRFRGGAVLRLQAAVGSNRNPRRHL